MTVNTDELVALYGFHEELQQQEKGITLQTHILKEAPCQNIM